MKKLVIILSVLFTQIAFGQVPTQDLEVLMIGASHEYDPKIKQDGKLLSRGFIAMQSEGQPIDFRKVEILNLEGCMDPKSKKYRRYFVKSNPAKCN